MLMRQFDDILQRASSDTRIAVVGASNHPLKYGYIVTQFLHAQGYKVWPVSKTERQVQGIAAYESLFDLPGAPDIVSIVTPPRRTIQLLRDTATIGCNKAWLQPGSYNAAVLREAAMSGLLVEAQRCIMVVSAQWVGEPAQTTA